MFRQEFDTTGNVCILENLSKDSDWAALECKDSLGLRGYGFFRIEDGKIAF
ncbi:MAG: hypothetical protein R3275_08050 [Saprospiraceae bacterium]|nr:hypothetical protein [Saprospiraceae bacterium]